MAEAVAAVKKSNGSGAKEPFQVKRGSRMKLRESACNDWVAFVDSGVKPEDLTKPNVFSLIKELKTFDSIRVFAEDRSFFAELVVTESDLGVVTVALLRSHDLPKVDPRSDTTLEGFELVQDAVERTWHAIRKIDKQKMFALEGIKTKNELVHRLVNDATVRQR